MTATASTPATTTKLEERLYAALDALGVAYERQARLGFYTVDAYLRQYGVVVEADGCAYHCCPKCCEDDPTPYGETAASRRAREARRDFRLRRVYGYRVIHIWGHDMESQDGADRAVRKALELIVGPVAWMMEGA